MRTQWRIFVNAPANILIFDRFERKVAFRYLRARKDGSISVIVLFSLLGIALGVATLIVVMSVMNGFREELMSRILGINGHLTAYSRDYGTSQWPGDSSLPWAKEVRPQIQSQAMAIHRNRSAGVALRAMEKEDLPQALRESLLPGVLEHFGPKDGILLGKGLSLRLGVEPGEELTLISPLPSETIFGTLPRTKSYRVAGVFSLGMHEYDHNFVYMPLLSGQLFFRMPSSINAIEIFLKDPSQPQAFSVELAGLLGAQWRIVDWQEANSSFLSALKVERNVMFLILSLIILVAAFNIFCSQAMLARDKAQEIAILRAMGATRGAILRIFLLSGACIGFLGAFFGLGIGVLFSMHIEEVRQFLESFGDTNLFSEEIYFLSHLPSKIEFWEVVKITGLAFLLSVLAPLWPAWKAAHEDPVETMRRG